MKIVTYAEFAALPEGTIFSPDEMPDTSAPALCCKGDAMKEIPGFRGEGFAVFDVLEAVMQQREWAKYMDSRTACDLKFRVYSPADLDRLAGLIGRGTAARQEGGSPC